VQPTKRPHLGQEEVEGVGDGAGEFDEGRRAAATLASEALREATRTQDAAAKVAHAFLMAARAAIARTGATDAQRAAFGLKLAAKPLKVSSVVAGLDAFVDAATRFPDVARGAGLLPADIDQARSLRAALIAADAAQETKKQTSRTPTAERAQLQHRIEEAVDAIVAAGTSPSFSNPRWPRAARPSCPPTGRARARSPAPPPRLPDSRPRATPSRPPDA
jgi:hypothetical protein